MRTLARCMLVLNLIAILGVALALSAVGITRSIFLASVATGTSDSSSCRGRVGDFMIFQPSPL
jgi:hypothetical protein